MNDKNTTHKVERPLASSRRQGLTPQPGGRKDGKGGGFWDVLG